MEYRYTQTENADRAGAYVACAGSIFGRFFLGECSGIDLFYEIDVFCLAYLHKTELCLLCINTMKKVLTFLYITTTMKENHGKEIHQ